MSILKNAVEAIQIGLEDFKSPDHRRTHSAVRNVFAGILLLFKEKLRQMSPVDSDEVLIKQVIVPTFDQKNLLCFQGKGKKTVDVQQIKERFKELQIDVNWKVFDEVNKIRNNVEHYYTKEPAAIINEIISKSFKIIRDFCVNHLNEDPVEMFGAKSWDVFLEVDEIYEEEKSLSNMALSKVDWSFDILKTAIEHVRCPICGSDLIHTGAMRNYEPAKPFSLNCRKCQNEFDFEEVLEDCVTEELESVIHTAVMDGADLPCTDCPECQRSTYIFDEECCLVCGYSYNYKSCSICATQLDIEEAYNGDLCSYHRWVIEKADD